MKDLELLPVRGGSTHTLRSLNPTSSGAGSQACTHCPIVPAESQRRGVVAVGRQAANSFKWDIFFL